MVTRDLAALLALAALACGAEAAEPCTRGSDLEPPLCPLILPKIEKITITRNAATSPADKDPSTDCSGFRLTTAHVRHYFAEAKSTNARDAHFTLDWSPCFATGKIVFDDGRTGTWSIDRLRAGSLVIEGRESMTLYCPECRFRRFQW